MIVGAQAQKCSQPCTKSASSSSCHAVAPSAVSAETSAAAAKLASLDPTIESRANPTTGIVSYYRKETCAHSGSVSYVDVSYDAVSNSFVNVSPMKMEGTGTGSNSCTGKASTTASGKACCTAGASAGKSCCAGKAASVKTTEKVKS